MGDRGRLRLRAAADLDRHHGLAELERPVGQRQESLRPLEPLDEQHDRVRLVVVDGVGEEVADVEDDLAAAADDAGEADPRPGVDEGIGHGARLGDPGHPAMRQPRVDVADVRGGVRRQVDKAHAVRAEEGDAMTEGDLADLALHPGGGLAALDDPSPGDDHRGHAGGGRVGHDRRRPQRIQGDDDDVRDLRELGDRRVAGLAVELVVTGIHEVAPRVAADGPDVGPDRRGDAALPGSPDNGDRPRCEQRPQVDRRERGVRRRRGGWPRIRLKRTGRARHPTTRATPRRSRARATISRWISEVPSHSRSTRSSRR